MTSKDFKSAIDTITHAIHSLDEELTRYSSARESAEQFSEGLGEIRNSLDSGLEEVTTAIKDLIVETTETITVLTTRVEHGTEESIDIIAKAESTSKNSSQKLQALTTKNFKIMENRIETVLHSIENLKISSLLKEEMIEIEERSKQMYQEFRTEVGTKIDQCIKEITTVNRNLTYEIKQNNWETKFNSRLQIGLLGALIIAFAASIWFV